jgi:hypothetical protein
MPNGEEYYTVEMIIKITEKVLNQHIWKKNWFINNT